MPLCSFYSLKIILMSVLFLHFSKSGNINCFATAAPLPSNSESRDGTIESAIKATTSNETDQAAPVGLQEKEQLQKMRNEEKVFSLALSDGPSLPSPTNVQLAFINTSSVLITWTYPISDHIRFVVQTSYDGDPYKNVSELLNSTEFVYSGMKSSAYYQFRVIAYVSGVASSPTQTNYFVNGITAPPGPPKNVMATLISHDVISLKWDPPSTPSPLIFIVNWGTNKTQLDREETVAQTTHVSFSKLELNQTYYFQVTADINSWLSVPSSLVQETTPPPDLPALTVHVNVSDEWTLITWSDPPEDRYPANVVQFEVHYGRLQERSVNYFNQSDYYTNVSVTKSLERNFNLTGLAPGSVWVVGVAYVSGKFLSEPSAPIQFETLEDVLCSACEPVSSTQLRVKWQVSTSLRKNRTIRVLEAGKLVSQTYTSFTLGELTVFGLHPWTSHSFEIALGTTYTGIQSDLCPALNCWTKEDAPSQSPTDIRISSITSRSVTLTWSQPPLDSRNGLITKYTVGYQCTSRFPAQECNTLQLATVADRPYNVSLLVDSLEPFTTYSFVVSASTRAGKGPFSFPLTAVTKEEVPDAPPTNISIINITATSFRVSWIPPPLPHQKGLITNYFVSLIIGCHSSSTLTQERALKLEHESKEMELEWGSKRTMVQNGTELLVAGLLPLTEYTVRVSAGTDVGEGPFSEAVCLSTLQSVKKLPLAINFTTTTNSAIGELPCYNVTFEWEWPPPLRNDSTKNDTVSMWSIFVNYKAKNDSNKFESIFVGENVHITMLTVTGLNESILTGRTVLFWLEIEATLSNGTILLMTSQPESVSLPLCGTSNDPLLSDGEIAVISSVGVLFACVLLLSLIVCCGCLFYKLSKMHPSSSQSTFRMGNFVSSEMEEGDYLLDPSLRVSDGRSSVSSSTGEESVRTSSESLNMASDASVICQCHSDNDSDLLDLSVDSPPWQDPVVPASSPPCPASGMSEQVAMPKGYVMNLDCLEADSRPHRAQPLAPRQNPDGCSLSSSTSSESIALLTNEQC